jgi:Chaperone of endosialidase
MSPLIQLKTTPPLLITLTLLCFGLLPRAQAVVPPPDGGYPGGNTAEGQNALFSLTTGTFNTAVGFLSLRSNTTGQLNTATGAGSLLANTADQNTANGAGALLSNTTGSGNTANGAFALFSNTIGLVNTATGLDALFSNTTGNNNTADGEEALESNTTGSHNAAFGSSAMRSNTTGSTNIALGSFAGVNLTTGDRNIDIGNNGVADESGTIRIGSDQSRTFIAGIRGVLVADSVPVVIDPAGQLGTIGGSSRRLKDHIKPMGTASQAILALKPVTFHYKSDKTNRPEFGLIAEEVAEVNPDLVVRDEKGDIYAVRYDAVNAMLLNEFLKEHRRVEEQQATIGQLKSNTAKQEATISELRESLGVLTAQLKEQAAQIQSVSARLEMSSPASRVVAKGR